MENIVRFLILVTWNLWKKMKKRIGFYFAKYITMWEQYYNRYDETENVVNAQMMKGVWERIVKVKRVCWEYIACAFLYRQSSRVVCWIKGCRHQSHLRNPRAYNLTHQKLNTIYIYMFIIKKYPDIYIEYVTNSVREQDPSVDNHHCPPFILTPEGVKFLWIP